MRPSSPSREPIAAGDVGTTRQDLETMGEVCSWVHSDETNLARSVARGVLAALRGAAAAVPGPRLLRSARRSRESEASGPRSSEASRLLGYG